MNTARLIALARHLESGKWGHEHFDMAYFNHGLFQGWNSCGTVGCGLGELPIIDPDNWGFAGGWVVPMGDLLIQANKGYLPVTPLYAAEIYFEIDGPVIDFLFVPEYTGQFNPMVHYRGPKARKELALRIRKFVEMRGVFTKPVQL